MFEVSIQSYFSSAHRLRGYKGKCESLHGHNWKVQVTAREIALDRIGLAIDFRDLKAPLNKIIKNLDHRYLNEISYFKKVNPTSENIAKYIYDKLKRERQLKKVNLLKITVWESANSYASYYE